MLYWPFWNREKGGYEPLSYLQARKKVYVPEYAKLVAHTPVGHAFVVKALLQGDLEVVDGKVIDHMGLAA